MSGVFKTIEREKKEKKNRREDKNDKSQRPPPPSLPFESSRRIIIEGEIFRAL